MQPTPIRLTVDGELFEVRARPGEPGTYDFNWLSGPNEGYGFGMTRSDGSVANREEMEASIRAFIAQIDRPTGYID